MADESKSTIFGKLKFLETLNIKSMHKNKKVFVPVVVIVFTFVILLILEEWFGLLSVSFLGSSTIKKNIAEIKALQKKVEKEQAEYVDILSRETQMLRQRHEYWVTSRDGEIHEKFQDKITSAAKSSKVELSTTGAVKLSKVGNGIMVGELEISCSGKMEWVVRFLHSLTYSTPKMYWDRFSLRPDNYNNPETIYLSGEVKFLIVDNKDILNLFTKVQK